MTPDVFESPLPLLLELERDGFDLGVRSGTLWIKPARRLTAEHRAQITEHRAALKALVLVCDDDVQDRLVVYKAQLAAVPAGSTPDFVYQRGTVHRRGVCFSCAAPLSGPEFGRCWRCSLAWRLAMRIPIAAELAAVYDSTKVVA